MSAPALWPTCIRCGRSLDLHYLRKDRAYCERGRSKKGRWTYLKANLSPIEPQEVLRLQLALGNRVTV